MMKVDKVKKSSLLFIFKSLIHDSSGIFNIDSSGKRISDLSGPLAQNKFSIFYMSTYQTDFVLVRTRVTHFIKDSSILTRSTLDQGKKIKTSSSVVTTT